MTFQIFTFIFLALTLIGFYLINPAYRRIFLTLSGFVFIFFQNEWALFILLLISGFTYLAGFVIDRLCKDHPGLKKTVFIISMVVFVALFAFWKIKPAEGDVISTVIIPVGFSFYTFQAVSYLADIYRGKSGHEKNVISFLLYMSWFPKFVSGPIERADSFIPKTDALRDIRLFEDCRIRKALSYVIWGLFLKLMIADRAGIIVDMIFETPYEYGQLMLILGSLLYTIQIYCDFAGYTDIAIGISVLFGLELTNNFKTPYFSENISEFWRSWHITLSSFLKDYIYIPLGGNRKGRLRKYLNLLAVFFVCGLWHGRSINFIIWGLLHGVFSILADLLKKTRLSFLTRGVAGKIATFCCVSFAWIFFRADSFTDALVYITRIITARNSQSFAEAVEATGTDMLQFIILTISVLTVFIWDLVASKKNTIPPDILINTGEIRRDLSFVLLAVIVLIFGVYGNNEVKGFIYGAF